MEQLHTLFKQTGNRLTTQRSRVFDVLLEADGPLSIREITERCTGINRSSIYRTLELFVQLNIIASVNYGWRPSYELVEPFRSHHHHLSCRVCNRHIPLELATVETLLSQIATKNKFTLESHTIELHGLCERCATPQTVHL